MLETEKYIWPLNRMLHYSFKIIALVELKYILLAQTHSEPNTVLCLKMFRMRNSVNLKKMEIKVNKLNNKCMKYSFLNNHVFIKSHEIVWRAYKRASLKRTYKNLSRYCLCYWSPIIDMQIRLSQPVNKSTRRQWRVSYCRASCRGVNASSAARSFPINRDSSHNILN